MSHSLSCSLSNCLSNLIVKPAVKPAYCKQRKEDKGKRKKVSDVVQGRQERKQKVVVLRELHRAIIYTTMIDKRACDKESREDTAHM